MTAPARAPRVLVLAGGGLGHVSGGVGTLMVYLQQQWATVSDPPILHVVDTRGAGGWADAAAHFLGAIAVTLWRALTGQADVVHAHMTTRGSAIRKTILCLLADAAGVPVILHMHGADFLHYYSRQPALVRACLRHVLRRARTVAVLGHGWRDFLAGIGVPDERIAIVANGVPAPPASPGQPAAPPPGPPRIVFLGRLGARKGVPELLQALAAPRLAVLDWHATLAGDGDVAGFARMAAAAGLAARVALPGWVDRATASALLAGAQILVLPSHHEAMPIAVLEALAHAVAVVTTPVGVIEEFLEHGASAVLVPPGDAPALAEAIAGLLEDAPRRARIAAAGHAVFARALDIRIVADRLLHLYRATAAPRPAPRHAGAGAP